MTVWNFNENKNYILSGNYKVLNLPDSDKAAKLLKCIDELVLRCFARLDSKISNSPELDLLLRTPYVLQEMQLIKDQGTIKFEGLNKPKEVQLTSEPSIGVDGQLRAKYRRIFLTLRHPDGRLKSLNKLKKLIAHEFAHTAMNHVRWRDDDHNEKFNYIYKLILKHFLLK